MITHEGMNLLINSGILGQSQTSTWYLLLIDHVDFKALDQSDTMSDHSGWIENTDYTQATRPQITFDTPATGQTKNSTAVVFTLNDDVTYHGFAVVSDNTKGGTSGTLLMTSELEGPVSELSGQNISATLEI